MEKTLNTKKINETPASETLETIISHYIILKKYKNSYSGLCPFHKGSKPSLIVWPKAQVFSCRVPGCIANAQERKKQLGKSDFMKLVEENNIPMIGEQIILIPKESKRVKRVSFSMLESFQLCPLNFKLIYLDKENIEKSTFNRQLGLSIHSTLRDFYRLSLESRSQSAMNSLLKKNWQVKNDTDAYWFDKAREMILPFADNSINFETITEEHFNYKVENIILTGFVDRIDKLPPNIYEVIDYKVLKKEPINESDAAESMQSIFLYFGSYSIVNEYPQKITYFHIQDGREVSFIPNHKSMLNKLAMIIDIVEEINKTKDFIAQKNKYCSACKLYKKCPATLA